MRHLQRSACYLILALALILAVPLAAAESIILASTTSTQASGFFDYFLPIFERKTGTEVKVVAVGTGQALKLAEKGDADVLLVHDKADQLKFVKQGYGVDRREVMYNDGTSERGAHHGAGRLSNRVV